MALDLALECLKSIPLVAWGEIAMDHYGVPTVLNSFMFIVSDDKMDEAVQTLNKAKFRLRTWSIASKKDPATMPDWLRDIHMQEAAQWISLDRNAIKFDFPLDTDFNLSRIVLLRPSYIGISPPRTKSEAVEFTLLDGMWFPSKYRLLESIARLRVKGDAADAWAGLLGVWVVTYIYGMTETPDDILDDCGDQDIIDWFNESIRRFDGGLTTCRDRPEPVQQHISTTAQWQLPIQSN